MASLVLHSKRLAKSLFAVLSAVVVSTTSLPVSSQILLTDPDPEVAPIITSLNEKRLARHFLHVVFSSTSIVKDPRLNAYITQLGEKLGRNANLDTTNFHFYLIDNTDVNALAGVGATFFFYTGAVELAANEGEFAAIVAHEIAHHSQNHLSQLLAQQKATLLPSMAAVLAGILIGGSEGIAASIAGGAAQIDSMIRFTRELEREADVIGLRILAASGYDPIHARNIMLSMEQSFRRRGAQQSTIHNTHPHTQERISTIEDRLNAYKGRTYSENAPVFALAKARIKVLYSWEPQKTTREFEEQLSNVENLQNLASLKYGYALSLSRDGLHNAALEQIRELVKLEPDNLWYLQAEGEIEISAGNRKQGLVILQRATQLPHKDTASVESYAEALIQSGQAAEAKKLVRREIIDNPLNPRLHTLHARASSEAGDRLTSHVSQAEYHFLTGDIQSAEQQLKIAAQLAVGNFYISEIIKEKEKQIDLEKAWRIGS